MRLRSRLSAIAALALLVVLPVAWARGAAEDEGILPRDASGRSLNFDFESGDLRDWKAEGNAFAGQPIEGDAVAARRSDMKSRHNGRFWVGTFERQGDAPRGTLTSATFVLDRPFARFLLGGGARETTRFEIVRGDTHQVVYRVSGDNSEDMKPVAADLSAHVGKPIFLRLVDADSNGWGHLNFDDFRLCQTRPNVPLRPSLPPPDSYAHQGLSPEAAAAAMTVPPGFKVTLFAGEPDVVQPIAFAFDHRGRMWVAEAYSYPIRQPAEKARDRILIFEDTNGDGRFDTRKVFADKLNLVSGIEVGFGGVWVGAAPEFSFIPDRDGDDRPDGPAVVLLDGWGYQDTHETLNTFNWGPDGWLYGCHGVFTHSRVGKPGTPDSERIPINAGIWRYHPTRHIFEVFAHGTSNPWGFDFDEHGQLFEEACVIPHLYHMIQGGRYERQAGQHFNPYTYDDIKTIADHRHYIGATPHSGNGRSDQAGGGHAHAGVVIYQGEGWPAEYRGSMFMNNIHGARLNRDLLVPRGSGFVGRHAPDFLLANDRWSQVVNLRQGPDGQIYMIDWYDENQCHRTDPNVHDRTNGRIFRVAYEKEARGVTGAIPVQATPLELVERVASPNEWTARHARLRLQELAPSLNQANRAAIVDRLQKRVLADDQPDRVRLHALWSLHAIGGLDERAILTALESKNAYVRAWTIQLATEAAAPTAELVSRFAAMARGDSSPVVRLYLASALQRLPLRDRWSIVEGLAGHEEDAADHNLPLMVWYGAEPLGAAEPRRALALALNAKLPTLLPFMVRRVAALGTPQAVEMLVESLGKAQSDSIRLIFLSEINRSLQGRRQVEMPKNWAATAEVLATSQDARVRSQLDALALTFGDPRALKTLRAVLVDVSKDLRTRQEALAALLKARDFQLPTALRRLLEERGLRAQAIRGLAAFEDSETPAAILKVYSGLTPEEKRDALNTLSARVESARALLAAVGGKQVPAGDLSADIVRQLRNHRDADLETQLSRVWGKVRETTADKARVIARYRELVKDSSSPRPDVELGRAMFAKTCQQCHTLFGIGGKIGPELTGSNRADLEYVLSNVLDPSSLIGKDYLAHVLSTTDGRILTGIIKTEDKDAVSLQTANELVVIPLGEIDERRPSEQSMMPEDLWTPLSPHEVRSLVAYLASPGQVPLKATRDNVTGFFNGKDLTGWNGTTGLWKVENGEIVGKTTGLKRNEFLVSDLSVENFRLTLQVKLIGDEGNSGIQFWSEARSDGEMKGYQADVGPGWWGKLYEENGRGLLWDRSGEAHVRRGEWNTYEIVASGSTIRTWINGQPCVDLVDKTGRRRGVFGLQLHSGGATEVRFKDLRLELEPKLTAPVRAARSSR